MPRVYIESTIPSFYHETRTDAVSVFWRQTTRDWWDNHRHRYELITSRYVHAELEITPGPKAAEVLKLLRDIPVLPEPAAIHDVADYYVEHKLMPKHGGGGDAMHLAFASLHNCEFLLTWNCQHLANANKIKHLGVLNGRLSLPVPILTTPMNLIPERP